MIWMTLYTELVETLIWLILLLSVVNNIEEASSEWSDYRMIPNWFVLINLIQEPIALRRLKLSRNASGASVMWRLQTTAVTTVWLLVYGKIWKEKNSIMLQRSTYVSRRQRRAKSPRRLIMFRNKTVWLDFFMHGCVTKLFWTLVRLFF